MMYPFMATSSMSLKYLPKDNVKWTLEKQFKVKILFAVTIVLSVANRRGRKKFYLCEKKFLLEISIKSSTTVNDAS